MKWRLNAAKAIRQAARGMSRVPRGEGGISVSGEVTFSSAELLREPPGDAPVDQGKGNQDYVRGLLAEIDRLKKNNDTMREKLLAAQRAK